MRSEKAPRLRAHRLFVSKAHMAWNHSWYRVLTACLLCVHVLLLGLSLPRNSVTVDEGCHLPAGMSHWHFGDFWCYHHNPPLIRLAFSLPAVVAGVPTDYQRCAPDSDVRGTDMSREFMMLNKNRYMRLYVMCRLVVVSISVLGGYLVYRWSRTLFGACGGLISLSMWTFCPEILAHGGLVTMDMGATVVALGACYAFWAYLKGPSLKQAILCGVLLGLAEGTKFSLVVLPAVWIVLGLWAAWTGRLGVDGARLPWRKFFVHAALACFVSLYVLNSVYLFEGTGRSLGSFAFKSRLLIGPKANDPVMPRSLDNRFHGSVLARLPVPLPEQYLLGLDDQMSDVDGGTYYKYLRGELRRGAGWWYYYLYYLAVKTPAGMMGLMFFAAVLAARRREYRRGLVDEACLIVPALALLTLVSTQTGLNFGRYALPVYPYLFILTGRLGPFLAASRRLWSVIVAGTLVWSAAGAVAVYPYFLTYFNEAAGGPQHGLEHLADSNIDWGQGLVGLKDWLDEHAPGRTVKLAYFGFMFPEVLGIRYELPPFGPGAHPGREDADIGPVPGLHAVSANYLVGVPFSSPNGKGSQTWVPLKAYDYFHQFHPIAVVAHSIYVYEIDLAEANRVRRALGLPELEDANDANDAHDASSPPPVSPARVHAH